MVNVMIIPVMTKEEFKDIAPFDDSEFKEKMSTLVTEPGFEHAVRYVLPMVDYPAFTDQLLSISDKDTFQRSIMAPFLEMLANKTSSGLSIAGLDNCEKDKAYTYISNHRDIVLDASFLNLCLLRDGFPTGKIALGDNLLIYDWIERLVKLNKGFIVKRNIKKTEALDAAKQLSSYIHYSVTQENESIWIAQRQGRAKDSDDRTQESLLKMLSLANTESLIDSLKEINLCPVTISYEYDPNDYLKATEFLLKRNNPDFHKSQHDDLLSMETGLLGYKGKIHYQVSRPINDTLDSLRGITDKKEMVAAIAESIDRQIHSGYRIYPSNYICFDRLYSTGEFSGMYNDDDTKAFDRYIEDQLKKVRLENLSKEDLDYMRHMMLVMYSNPLKNKLATEGRQFAGLEP